MDFGAVTKDCLQQLQSNSAAVNYCLTKEHQRNISLLICRVFETEYLIAVPANSHQKIVWFNVSMNEVLVVDIFHSSNHLQHRNTNIER